MTFEIRAGRADEIDRLYAVHRDSVIRLCAGHYSDEQIRGWLSGRTPAMYLPAIAAGRLWVADDGEPIGFAEIDGRELTKLFIRGDRAANGVGRRLLAHALAAIRAGGAASAYLEATLNARAFYARHGFVEIGRGAFSHGAGGEPLEIVRMERPLGAVMPRHRPVALAAADVDVTRRRDGSIVVVSRRPLGRYPVRLTDRLDEVAASDPDRPLLAERAGDGDGWRILRYGEAHALARRIGEALLARQLSPERPVAVLSGNDIEHALIELGALYAGVPYAPISPAYSLVSSDHAKLRAILALLTPGLVYAAHRPSFAAALAAVPDGVEVCCKDDFAGLAAAPATSALARAHAAITGDTIAKFLFTSGSTGEPKAVINTQRMWCANQEMIRSVLAYFRDEPPVILDWAPWHHTAGGNHDFGLVIYNGGTLYIDDGRPVPGAIEATVRNLTQVSPTWYFNVPRGFEALLPFLRSDAALRRSFFRRLKVLWFAGAGLSQAVFDELRQLARDTVGEEILVLTGLGSTETAPFALGRTWPTDDASNIGLPAPGVELKLVPVEGKYEARLKGPNIMPGYWRQPALTRQAFDDEGYYCLGDSFVFARPDDPAQGLLFRGRVSEDFKLSTGTWVHVGPLRARLLARFAPLVQDVVIAGEGRGELAILVFPAAAFAPDAFRERLAGLDARGSSERISRALVLREPPSLDAGEITDKGTINQKAVLRRRGDLVDRLYREPAAGEPVILGV